MKALIMIITVLVIAEFGVHVIYHWKTGKAGTEEPAFAYLKDIAKLFH